MNPKDPRENGTRGGTGPLNSDAACANTEANNQNLGHDIYSCQSKNLITDQLRKEKRKENNNSAPNQ